MRILLSWRVYDKDKKFLTIYKTTMEEKEINNLMDKMFKQDQENRELRNSSEELTSKTKRTFGYMIAYLTMFYFDISRIQGQKKPQWGSEYYQEKIGCFIREIDSIWWDNFKRILQTVSLRDMVESYYLWIWLWWVPGLGIDLDKFYKYQEWDITEEEFYWFLDNNQR